MQELNAAFQKFVVESPNRLKYLFQIGELLNQIHLKEFQKNKITEELFEYVIEVKRNSLLSYITLTEFLDVKEGELIKRIEIQLAGGDSYPLSPDISFFRSISFAQKLMLDVETSDELLLALIIDFGLYDYLRSK